MKRDPLLSEDDERLLALCPRSERWDAVNAEAWTRRFQIVIKGDDATVELLPSVEP